MSSFIFPYKHTIIVLVYLALCPIICTGQRINKTQILQNITNRYWYSRDGDNWYVVDSVSAVKLGNGFILKKDGTYKEIKRRQCNRDREPTIGNWEIKNDSLLMHATTGRVFRMRIIEIDGGTFKAK
jgi:hypothetical protein